MTFYQVTFPSSQMNMWILKAIFLLLFCSVCLSTENESVYFSSRNFNNTLHWKSVDPARPGENITYSVEYKKHADGEEYQKKAGCQNITALLCDLTEETPAIPDGHYWARVFVNGELHGSTKTRFTPLASTTFGPPTLSINSTVSVLHVRAIPPLGPNGESIRDIVARSNNGFLESQLVYTLKITDPKWAVQDVTNTTGQFILNLKNHNTKYCGHVFYRPSAKWGRSTSENATFCIKSSANPLNFLPWLLFMAIFLLALLVVSFVCVCKYVKGVKSVSTPSTLIISKTPTKVLQPQNEANSFSELVVYLGSAKKDIAAIHQKQNVPTGSVGGYSPQDIPCQIWKDSSTDTAVVSRTSDSQDNSGQSSVTYGAVVVHDPTEDQGAIKNPGISNKLIFSMEECGSNHAITSMMPLHIGSAPSVQDNLDGDPSRPLLLHTERDSDGNLVLPFPSFQSQSSTANLQRRPLLSDLTDSMMAQPSLSSLLILDGTESECDDGIVTSPTQTYCNSHYHHTHAGIPSPHQANLNSSSTDGTSCYMQNWVPELNIETVPMHSDFDRRTDYPCTWNGLKQKEDETEEEEKELESFPLREHFLGNWAVHVQD